jgi:hypothetical protein
MFRRLAGLDAQKQKTKILINFVVAALHLSYMLQGSKARGELPDYIEQRTEMAKNGL